MFKRVLLAMDLSPQSEHLLPCLFSMCPEIETEIIVAHVFEDAEDADPDSSGYKKTESKIQGYINDIGRAGYENVSYRFLQGEVFEELNVLAETMEVELVLVASHGKGFFRSAFLGSTTFDLARATQKPLFVSKPKDDDIVEHENDLLKKILIPTDFSRKSLEALNFVRGMREHVSEVVFVHIVERGRNQRDLDERMERAQSMLAELVDEMNIFGIPASFRLGKGDASKEICRLIDAEDFSLITMTKTGAGLVKGLVMGSTAQNVTLAADKSLLLLPTVDISNDN